MPDHPEPDEYSTWHDLSNPGLSGKSTEPEDILNPEQPSGWLSLKKRKKRDNERKTGLRWFLEEEYENE